VPPGLVKGIIDEVRIYNRALTAVEVLNLFNEDLLFEPIGDKEVDEASSLVFEVNILYPDIVVDINDHNLPSEPYFVDNSFSWTPTYDDAGSYQVEFVAYDGEIEEIEIVTITVNNVNRRPVIEPISDITVDESVLVTFAVNATDPDGDDLTYFADNLPDGAVFSSQTFEWTPGYGQAGTYILSFVATDGELEDVENVTITVNDIESIKPVYRFCPIV